jgi:hypothetical protein
MKRGVCQAGDERQAAGRHAGVVGARGGRLSWTYGAGCGRSRLTIRYTPSSTA